MTPAGVGIGAIPAVAPVGSVFFPLAMEAADLFDKLPLHPEILVPGILDQLLVNVMDAGFPNLCISEKGINK